MLSKRVIAVAADKAFGKRLAAGLMGAGAATEVVALLDELAKGEIKADLVVVQLADEHDPTLTHLASRIGGETRVIAVVPASSLAAMVTAMKQCPRVSAVLTADDFTPAALSAVATRLLYGDVFGLEKVVPWGVKVYSTLVGDYQEKSVAIAAVSDFAGQMGVRRKYREAIEQCLDEMLMNALYDAPVDASGKQMFAEVPTKTRISLRMEQKAVVQYACEGSNFYLSVRDSFGALKGETVVKYLDKCLTEQQQIDRKAGGAGLGLYLISSASSQLLFNIYPGVATEAVTTFDLAAPKVQLKRFGIFQEKIDSSGRLVAGPSKLLAPGASAAGGELAAPRSNRALNVGLGVAIVLLLALIGIVGLPRLRGAGHGSVAVTTTPVGAQVFVDGAHKGTSPVEIKDLVAGQKYDVSARISGYEEASQIVTPQKGETVRATLVLEAKQPTLVIKSQPSGATVLGGDVELGTTPLTLTNLPAGTSPELTLRKLGYSDLTEKVEVPRPGGSREVLLALSMSPDFGSVRIESDPPGAQVLQNGELLAGLSTPVAEHIVQADREYRFTLKLAGRQPRTVAVLVRPGTRAQLVRAELPKGGAITIETNVPEAKITIDGVPACVSSEARLADCPLPDGKYRVRVAAKRPFTSETLDVTVAGDDVSRKLDFGFVETPSSEWTLQIPGAPSGTRRAAFTDGTRTVKLVNSKTGSTVAKSVRVVAGRTITVDVQ